MKTEPLGKNQAARIERRAAELWLTMGDVCDLAVVSASTWSRAKKRGRIRSSTMEKIEGALDQAKADKAAQA